MLRSLVGSEMCIRDSLFTSISIFLSGCLSSSLLYLYFCLALCPLHCYIYTACLWEGASTASVILLLILLLLLLQLLHLLPLHMFQTDSGPGTLSLSTKKTGFRSRDPDTRPRPTAARVERLRSGNTDPWRFRWLIKKYWRKKNIFADILYITCQALIVMCPYHFDFK